jgi:uncharacterized protein YdaU (DUF1376 family)
MEKAMHYYQFHIGDYRAATAHLTNDEDLAYRRLLDMYYDTETPIPLDIDWVSRRLRLGQDVIENVLNDMFKLSVDGYIHTRCDSEIQKYHSKADSARKANQIRWGSEKVLKSDADQILTNNHKPITNNQEYIDRFDIFWKQYPRKVAKPNALKAWLKIKPDDVVLKKMLDAINHQQLPSKEIQFVPHPASWLNANRWEDEITAPTTNVMNMGRRIL